ncbi:MAG: hypothetical protein QHC88_04340 [Achromobacter sp.]|uniref:hypothetical protein n=1 Tax=unclassified Achromobacter TaxID=2626865 RepID=UPI000AA1FA6A|nr:MULTISPECIES: hypothetical protein [unclassified Achromobacter]MDX3984465.1 hypothetical protein [Achromobacter sp.]
MFTSLNNGEHRSTKDVHKREQHGKVPGLRAGWHGFFPRAARLPILANAGADSTQA